MAQCELKPRTRGRVQGQEEAIKQPKRHRIGGEHNTMPKRAYVKEERLLRPHNVIGFVIGAFVGDQRHERDERERRRDMRISIKQNKRSSTNAILVLRGLTPRWPPWIHDRIRSRAYS
ncbi:PREDICTED: PRUPE_6G346000 [Prunus dulcis]|uniref:PREDICTED: PRUPE_6G346000 n=1 Tax=Prunus dulcis TaxID=3755 RepID=A0A5E4EC13_PRUDU|nr:PREDICTED: PRUPE_6G346000 [Prunus dulcis]